MPSILRYSTNARGSMVITGNTLGLLGRFNPPDATDTSVNANGIGAFTSLNNGISAPGGYPLGTTFDWRENGSDAIINIPASAKILYAELAWSGSYLNNVQDVSAFLNNTIIFNTPLGSFQVNPDPATAGSVVFPSNGVGQYFRSANVTSLVNSGTGTYSVQSVPGVLGGTPSNPVVENNYLGWSLEIAYEDVSLPYRNMNVWTIFDPVDLSISPIVDIPVSGFSTPISGPIEARLLVSAGEGDPQVTGDQVLFGPNISGLVALQGEPPSPPNNPVNNFFVSRINDGNSESLTVGQVDTLGSFGTLNQPVPTTIDGRLAPGRYGYDITNVNASLTLINSQTNALIRLTTTGDGYVPNLLGLQIDSNSPIVSINKSAPATATRGSDITYTLTVTNTGVIQADTVTVLDPAPTGTIVNPGSVLVQNATGPVVNNSTAATLNVDIGPLLPNQVVIIQYTVSTTGTTPSPVLNSATANYTFVPVPGGPIVTDASTSNGTTTELNTSADISVVKSGSPNPVVAGNTLTYTMVVSNAGPSDAQSVTLTDSLPSCITNPVYSINGGATNPWPVAGVNLGTIGAGATPINVTISGKVNPSCSLTSLVNTATVNSTTPDPNTSNNSSTVSTTVNTSADISVVKTGSPNPVVAGNTLTYTMVVKNVGPSDAQSVTLTDPVPSCITNPVYSINGGTTNPWPAAGVNLGTIAVGATPINVTISGTVNPACSLTSLPNTATVNSTTPDPNTSNNSSSITTTVNTSADISVVKSGSPDPVVAGNTLTYTMVVKNVGPSDAQSVTLTDLLPSCITNPVYSINGGSTNPWPVAGVNLGTIGAGATPINVTISGTVNPSCSLTSLPNTATVNSTTPDPNTSNNSSSITTTVNTSADISVVKSGSPDPVVAGNTLTYTMVVKNVGPSDAQSVTLTDSLPSCITNPVYSINGGTTNPWPAAGVNLGTIGVGATPINVTISGTVNPSCSLTSLPNTATVNSTTPDPNTSNNSSSITTGVNTSADISVVKTDSPSPVIAGNVLTYTMVVANAGPSTAKSVSLADVVSTSLLNPQYSTDNGSTWFAWTSPYNVGDLVPNGKVTILIRGTIDPAATGSILNKATVSSPTQDPNPNNNSSDTTTPINTLADISVVKTSNPSPVIAGNVLTYTIVASNAGPSVAQSVSLIDVIPSTLLNPEYSTDGGTTWKSWVSPYSIGNLIPGGKVTVLIRGTIDQAATGNILNTATVSSLTPDPNPGNNSSNTTTPINTSADISVVKTQSPNLVIAGNVLTYTLVISNAGPSAAQSVSLADAVPSSILNPEYSTNVGNTWNAWVSPYNVGNLAPGGKVTILIRGTIDPASTENITNTAIVNSPTPDPNPNNNTSTIPTQINPSADVSIVKKVNPNPVVAGEEVDYTIVVTNSGPSNAQNVVLNDVVPSSLSNVQFSVDSGKTWEVWSNPYTIGTLTPNGSVTILIKGILSSSATGNLVNTATVSSKTPDPNPNNNTSTQTTPINPSADIAVVKTANPTEVISGNQIVYTMVISNKGPSDAVNVTLSDAVPACVLNPEYLLPGSSTWIPWSGPINLKTIVPGSSVTIKLRGTVNPSCTSDMTNTATVTSDTPDPNPNNNTSKIVTPVKTSADVSVVKTANSSSVIVGQLATYTIVISNSGPSDAQNVSLADVVPASIVNVQFSIDNGKTWTNWSTPYVIGTLPAAQKVTILIRGKATKGLTDNVTNTATITSSTPDPNPANNTSNVTIKVYNPELTLTKGVDKQYAIVGDIVTYTVVAKNTGNTILGNVELSPITIYDILSPSLSFVAGSVTVDGVSDPQSGIVTGVDIGELQPGQSRTVTFKAKVTSNTINPITNTSNAKFGYQIPGYPPQTSTANSNTVSLVPEIANIDILKTSDKDFVVLNDTIIYTVILKNTGTLDATNVIFKDALPSNIQLIDGTFKVNDVSINGVSITNGVNIGTIKVGQQAVVQYTVKVVSSNCELKIVNSASVNFNYTLPNGVIGTTQSGPTSTSSDVITLGISDFKQLSVEEQLIIPCEKPDIEEISEVTGDIEIIKSHAIKTPTLTSNEGQILTGYKLIIHGVINEVVEYTALDREQTVHSAHYAVPFTTFIVLPENYCPGNVEIKPEVEDIYYKELNQRTVFSNATILIKATVCRCDNTK